MVAYIDAHRDRFGVEPICHVLPIAPSTYFRHKAEQRDPTRRSARAQRDEVLRAIIRRIYQENRSVYGPRKVWKQMGREGLREARCRVRRLMRTMGLAGVVRGRAWTTTTHAGPEADRPLDLVERHFAATRPNELWVSDFTYVATWRGFVYVAFVIDVFAPAASSAGGSRRRSRPTSSSTRSSKPLPTGARTTRTGSCITAIAAHNISRCATPIDSAPPASRHRSAVAVIRTTRHWPNR
jgi:putative transposase